MLHSTQQKQEHSTSSSSMSCSLSITRFLLGFIWAAVALPSATQGWIMATPTPSLLRPRSVGAPPFRPRRTTLLDSSSTSSNSNSSSSSISEETAITSTTNDDDNDDDDEDDEYEYIEYEALTEAEFVNSEWLVGSNWDANPSKIEETWARCIVDKDGKNVVVWGDNASGKWSLDVASQFFSMSKENVLMGKKIWACTVEDYYYLQGTIRGWNFLQPASVLGQWQARRLGVDKDEAGTAPWFQEEGNKDDGDNDSPSLAATTAAAATANSKDEDE